MKTNEDLKMSRKFISRQTKVLLNLALTVTLLFINCILLSAQSTAEELSGNNKKAEIEHNTKITIDITESNKYPSNLSEFHPDRQVEIYNILSPVSGKPAIALNVYRKGGIQPGKFIYEHPNKYEKAIYEWANDSTVSFKLFNTTNRFSLHFTYRTHVTGSSLQIDSINNVPVN